MSRGQQLIASHQVRIPLVRADHQPHPQRLPCCYRHRIIDFLKQGRHDLAVSGWVELSTGHSEPSHEDDDVPLSAVITIKQDWSAVGVPTESS
ncbi:hypothetical protein RRG08_014202 [Elysia crispata]|uniref:Uncharacterized protein n=1 Tax=Elysia crispata TaxID=231223 RepID=A0AAE0Z364_9GAST|nr:hypothetical protein RRG08_014202 [Elysia crispata]